MSMYQNNPMLNQQMAQLEQEFLQRKQNLMQNFYAQNQPQNNYHNTQPEPSAQSQPMQNVNWVYVSGVDGAENQIVQPGQTVWMMDNNNPYMYAKAVDKFGTPEFHAFFVKEVSKEEINQQIAKTKTQTQIDLSDYVPRGEFDALKEQVKQLATTQKKQPVKENKGGRE